MVRSSLVAFLALADGGGRPPQGQQVHDSLPHLRRRRKRRGANFHEDRHRARLLKEEAVKLQPFYCLRCFKNDSNLLSFY